MRTVSLVVVISAAAVVAIAPQAVNPRQQRGAGDLYSAVVAQSSLHASSPLRVSENHAVGSSILPLGTTHRSSPSR